VERGEKKKTRGSGKGLRGGVFWNVYQTNISFGGADKRGGLLKRRGRQAAVSGCITESEKIEKSPLGKTLFALVRIIRYSLPSSCSKERGGGQDEDFVDKNRRREILEVD